MKYYLEKLEIKYPFWFQEVKNSFSSPFKGSSSNKEDEKNKSVLSRVAAAIAFCLVAFVLLATFIKAQPVINEYKVSGQDYQSIKVLGQVLLNDYMVPFEFASVLLLVSMIGAVLLSKKEHINN